MSDTQEFTLRAMAHNYTDGHVWDHLDTDACMKAADEIKALRSKLFQYADATEISGVSWDGKYLIGDKASIKFFHEMKNRGEQIDVYKRAYDQNLAAKEEERAEQWRLRREAEGSRDAAMAACDSMRAERDKLREIVQRAQAIISTSTYPNWHEAARTSLNASERESRS